MIDTETECHLCNESCPNCGRDLTGREISERFALEMARKDLEIARLFHELQELKEQNK